MPVDPVGRNGRFSVDMGTGLLVFEPGLLGGLDTSARVKIVFVKFSVPGVFNGVP